MDKTLLDRARFIQSDVLDPVLAWMGGNFDSPEALVALTTFSLQEDPKGFRKQMPSGPARSWWQIEPQTAAVVWRHPAIVPYLRRLGMPETPSRDVIVEILRWSEWTAVVIARGILWMDPKPLPKVEDADSLFHLYVDRTWRPGAWHKGTPEQRAELTNRFMENHEAALTVFREAA